MLILLAFLKSVRATLLAAVSIPLSLVVSFVFIRLTGDTLNLMSLGGLALGLAREPALLAFAAWGYQTANRLDRLHVRYDLSWQALDSALAISRASFGGLSSRPATL